MSFLKKNLLLCIFAVFCLAAFVGGVYMTMIESGAVKDVRRSLNNAETQQSRLLNADPAPTEDNLAAAENNLNELQAALAEIREELQSGSNLETSDDGVSVIAGIQQYISQFQEDVETHENEEGEATPIETADNFAFGFEQYIDEASVPENPAKIALLDKQRQILSYLLTQLIMAGPQSIDVVKREVSESQNGGSEAFLIDPAISARVPGAIETTAFSLTFNGYTDALREFLNRLARFELPIVVRSIEVTRPSGSETVTAPPPRDSPEDLFGLFEEEDSPVDTKAGSAETTEPPAEAEKPVIEENISQFTVILEFIEIVLPDATNQDVPDPA